MVLGDLLKTVKNNEIVEISYLNKSCYNYMGDASGVPNVYYNDIVEKTSVGFGMTEDIVFLRIEISPSK